MENIKLLVFDIDGTLIDRSKQTVEESAKNAISKARDNGYEVLIATGRSFFFIHDDVKKRTLECFLETAKIALRGRNKKFQYILPDSSIELVEIEGDQFAEADFGLVVDSSQGAQEFKSQLETLAQAALQNQSLRFSTITKLFSTSSLAEKQRIIEKGEEEMIQSSQEQQQAEQEMAQQQLEAQEAQMMMQLEHQERMNIRDSETRIEFAEI